MRLFETKTFCPNYTRGPLPPVENNNKHKVYIVMAYKWDEYDEHKDVFVDRVFKHKSDALAYIIRHQSDINMCDANPMEMKVY